MTTKYTETVGIPNGQMGRKIPTFPSNERIDEKMLCSFEFFTQFFKDDMTSKSEVDLLLECLEGKSRSGLLIDLFPKWLELMGLFKNLEMAERGEKATTAFLMSFNLCLAFIIPEKPKGAYSKSKTTYKELQDTISVPLHKLVGDLNAFARIIDSNDWIPSIFKLNIKEANVKLLKAQEIYYAKKLEFQLGRSNEKFYYKILKNTLPKYYFQHWVDGLYLFLISNNYPIKADYKNIHERNRTRTRNKKLLGSNHGSNIKRSSFPPYSSNATIRISKSKTGKKFKG